MVSILVDNAGPVDPTVCPRRPGSSLIGPGGPVDPSHMPRVAGSFLIGRRGPVVDPSISGPRLVDPRPFHVTATWVVTCRMQCCEARHCNHYRAANDPVLQTGCSCHRPLATAQQRCRGSDWGLYFNIFSLENMPPISTTPDRWVSTTGPLITRSFQLRAFPAPVKVRRIEVR